MNHFDKEDEIIKQKKRNKKIITINNIILIFIFCITIIGFFMLGNYMGSKGKFFVKSDATSKLKGIDNVEDFEKLFLVRDMLYKHYDGEINNEDLLEGAIKGMTAALDDPYTVFMNEEKYKSFNDRSNGHYLGIGIEMKLEDEEILVSKIMKNGPASKTEISVGDTILSVNNQSLDGDLKKALDLIQGEQGTEVTLKLKNTSKGEYEVKIVRDVVKIEAVESEMLEGGIGYISISGFDDNVSKEFNDKLEVLNSNGLKGLILDLRDNTGGYLDESIKIASQFIPKGETIVSTKDKYDNKNRYVSIGGIGEGIPLVVLVNGISASASEVVSGALRDHGVATLVGTRTYGKGVVQDILNEDNSDLTDGSALKVTTAKYYTPNGENIHKKGIEPNIIVEYPEELLEENYDRNKDPQFKKALETIKSLIK